MCSDYDQIITEQLPQKHLKIILYMIRTICIIDQLSKIPYARSERASPNHKHSALVFPESRNTRLWCPPKQTALSCGAPEENSTNSRCFPKSIAPRHDFCRSDRLRSECYRFSTDIGVFVAWCGASHQNTPAGA